MNKLFSGWISWNKEVKAQYLVLFTVSLPKAHILNLLNLKACIKQQQQQKPHTEHFLV